MFDWWFNYSGVEIFGSFLFGCICVIVLLLGSFDILGNMFGEVFLFINCVWISFFYVCF